MYRITLSGCDDQTEVRMNLTKRELQLVEEISKLSIEESTYGCMPVLLVEEINGGQE